MAAKIKPIPDGFHTLTPHLIVRQAAQAIEFYKKAFGAEEVMRMNGPDGKSVMHAELKFGNSMMMICEEFPDMCRSPQSLGGSPVVLHFYVEDADTFFAKAVKAGATPTMPLADQFWGDRYGKLKDPFGHEWSIASHVKDVTPEECQAAMAQYCSEPVHEKKK